MPHRLLLAWPLLLLLQGACGTCPSSTATMKMGIERSLKAAFGDQLLEVLQVRPAHHTGGYKQQRVPQQEVRQLACLCSTARCSAALGGGACSASSEEVLSTCQLAVC